MKCVDGKGRLVQVPQAPSESHVPPSVWTLNDVTIVSCHAHLIKTWLRQHAFFEKFIRQRMYKYKMIEKQLIVIIFSILLSDYEMFL